MDSSLTQKPGSVFGAILLITGCCIGAGMLGMPVMSAMAGFFPSLIVFLFSWIFMTTTALLLLEVNLWFSDDVSIISMADRTLGRFGKAVAWICYIFLFYTLGIAYIAGSGELLADFFLSTFQMNIPNWVGSLAVSALFGLFVYSGTRTVDLFNRLLMAGLAITYVLLVSFGAPHVKEENLSFTNWSAAPFAIPIMIISFGFHNLIPSLTTYLKGNAKNLKIAIISGSAIALTIYLLWEFVILGLIPLTDQQTMVGAMDHNNMATEILSRAVGTNSIVRLTQYFAFFAIVTSFLGNSLSFVDFLADGLNMKKNSQNKLWICFLVIAPPFSLAMIYPKIFLIALNYAGAFGAVTLFGILPALMVWAGRYNKKFATQTFVPGGKIVLLGIILLSGWMMWLYT